MLFGIVYDFFLSLAFVAVLWPALLILGGYVDDPDNYVGAFFLGTLVLVWWFL